VGRGAAFFDMDRTLLKGASGPVISRALRSAGLVSDRNIPGEGAMYALFDLVGETLPAMALARGAALLAKGWDADQVRAAGREAAEELVRDVTPYALPLIHDHQAKGRPVVLATTTPDHLVRPLAERLGFDDVIATRYGELDGAFTGSLEGEFVWATGKRSAVAAWARANDIDLAESYAYSDSIYDLPLLLSVGHPCAVNPDPRLLAAATLARWPVLHLDAPPGVPKVLGVEPYDVVRRFAHPAIAPYARFSFDGVEHIPSKGPGIVVSNHRSYFDPVALVILAAKAGRLLRFLGKKEVFEAPLLGPAMRRFGHIRVDRGSGSDAPLDAAAAALEAGELICILPQGTIPRGEAFFDPELKGRPGAARLAARSGAPVLPVGLWGTEAVWPRSSKVPLVWNVLHPPHIDVRAGKPIDLDLDDPRADTTTIMQAIQALLPEASKTPRTPTKADLRRATP
jgi:putative phosphoserine phosphatase/1-acylglycerol-3-phosphate O-acyltransferase